MNSPNNIFSKQTTQNSGPTLKKGQMASNPPDNSNAPRPTNSIFNQANPPASFGIANQSSNSIFNSSNFTGNNSITQNKFQTTDAQSSQKQNVFGAPMQPQNTSTNKIFSQNPTQPGFFASLPNTGTSPPFNQQSTPNTFGQNQQNPNQGQHNQMFGINSQNSNNSFGPNSQNMFQSHNQGQPIFAHGHPTNNQEAKIMQYIEQHHQWARRQHPEQNMSQQGNNIAPQIISRQHFNPRKQDADYKNYLNFVMNNPSIKNYSTSKELLDFAQGWANEIAPNQRYSSLQQARRQQIQKLFDAKQLTSLSLTKMRQIQPVQITTQLIQSMNDELSCRNIMHELWQRCKSRFEQQIKIFKALQSKISLKDKDRKVMQCDFHQQLIKCWRGVKDLAQKMKSLAQFQKSIDYQSTHFNQKILGICQQLKGIFVVQRKQNQIVREASQEIQQLSSFFDRQIIPMFKDFTTDKVHTFQNPDTYVLELTSKLLARFEALNYSMEEMVKMRTFQMHDISIDQLIQELCQYYQTVAQKLFEVYHKVKEFSLSIAKQQNFQNYEQILNKIQEKATENLDQKMIMFNRIKEIEQILIKRDHRLKYHQSAESEENNGKFTSLQVRKKASIFAGMSKNPEPSQ